MTYVPRTIEDEAERRAARSGVPATVIRPYVEQEIGDHRIRLTYESLPHTLELAEIVLLDGAHWVTFNLRHPYVLDVMLDERVTPATALPAVEITLMTVLGIGDPDLEKKIGDWSSGYATHLHELSERLRVAAPILITCLDLPETGWDDDDD